ncbi:hypothetical protein INR75_20135 [Zunongwangia sp. SCSIO 43204]|uniref:hypothetical protein n=1 Tax=Zunongwangia sp. SCSIO 43204 TaxID=2779359 RepID=UPI001CA899EC|nr:hypothetical protein [Zunongwangia sp. SCSIO 43204]UAB84430.1 hypothetical protein INR75_20135 [Zunongwangia sp. SCSIO 43204]
MKTLIITCGCLEPSKDGIGDYCFNLAKAIKLLGVKVVLVSINDFYVKSFREETREDIQLCRIPARNSWQQKYRLFKNISETVSPDHISFQYVTYAFHKKGLPVVAHQFLVGILKSYEVSIMMHEPWIGRSKEDSLRHKVIGYFQQIIIKQLINGISPIKVFTSNIAFSRLLKENGIQNKVLPLFSNIPFSKNALQQLPQLFNENQLFLFEKSLKIVLFGRIPFSWRKEELVRWLKDKNVTIMVAGRSDQDSADNLRHEIKGLSAKINFIALGELSKEQVSTLLQYADAGLALTPPQILGKSGVVAAYKEHGLPIILAGNNELFLETDVTYLEQLDKLSLDISLDDQLEKLKRKPSYSGVQLIAETFLNGVSGLKEAKNAYPI